MAQGVDEDSERGLVFRIGSGESIASPPFAQNAKDGPPANDDQRIEVTDDDLSPARLTTACLGGWHKLQCLVPGKACKGWS